MDRIPTAQIKHVMQKGKKVMIKVEKHIRKVVPQSSKLHVYLSRKSSALFRRLNNEFFAISDHIINVDIIAVQTLRVCVCFLYKQEP